MLTMDRTEIYDVHFDLTVPKPGPSDDDFQGGFVDWPLMLDQIFIGVPGQESETFQKLADEEWSKDEGKKEYEIQFPERSVLTVPDYPEYPAHGYSITGARFKVRFNPPLKEEIVVRADDHIYMIMESLLDGRRFTITTDGEIKENTLLVDEGESASELPPPS